MPPHLKRQRVRGAGTSCSLAPFTAWKRSRQPTRTTLPSVPGGESDYKTKAALTRACQHPTQGRAGPEAKKQRCGSQQPCVVYNDKSNSPSLFLSMGQNASSTWTPHWPLSTPRGISETGSRFLLLNQRAFRADDVSVSSSCPAQQHNRCIYEPG